MIAQTDKREQQLSNVPEDSEHPTRLADQLPTTGKEAGQDKIGY